MRAWVLRQVVGFHSFSNVPHKHYTILQTDEKCKSAWDTEEISFRFNSREIKFHYLFFFHENEIISTSCHRNDIAARLDISILLFRRNEICNEIIQRKNPERYGFHKVRKIKFYHRLSSRSTHSCNCTRAAPPSSITYVNIFNFRSPIAYRRRIILSIVRALAETSGCSAWTLRDTRWTEKKRKRIYTIYIIRGYRSMIKRYREQGNFGKCHVPCESYGKILVINLE